MMVGTPGVGDGRGLLAHALRGASVRDTRKRRREQSSIARELDNTPLEKRTAHYVCHVTVADPTGTIRAESHDICRGRIRFEPAGTNGFGYDPLFEVVEYHRTFGELGPHVKAGAQPPLPSTAGNRAAADSD